MGRDTSQPSSPPIAPPPPSGVSDTSIFLEMKVSTQNEKKVERKVPFTWTGTEPSTILIQRRGGIVLSPHYVETVYSRQGISIADTFIVVGVVV